MEIDQKELKKIFSTRNPSYTSTLGLWKKMMWAYNGDDEAKKMLLWIGAGEESEDFIDRLKHAAYENHMKDIISRREAIVYGRKITREIKDSAAAAARDRISNNIDGQGTHREDFIRNCFTQMQIFGWIPVLIDRPRSDGYAETKAQEGNNDPYAVIISPMDFLNWQLDEHNKLNWCILKGKTITSGGPLEFQETYEVYRIIDKEKIDVWEVREVKKNGKKDTEYVRAEGSPFYHNLGVVPVIFLYDMRDSTNDLIGVPSLLSSMEQSVLLFNYQNWSTEVAMLSNYNFLSAEDTGTGVSGEVPEALIGPRYIFWTPQGANPPQWISPSVAPIDIFRQEIQDIRRRVYENAQVDAGHSELSRAVLSGDAYRMRSRETEEMARRLALNMESFESQLDTMMLVHFLDFKNANPRIQYPKRYGTKATSDAIDELKAVEELTSLPPEVKKAVATNFVNTEVFAELPDEELAFLEAKIKEYDPVKAEADKVFAETKARIDAEAPKRDAEIAKAESQKLMPEQLLKG